jgi:hypothetical protein
VVLLAALSTLLAPLAAFSTPATAATRSCTDPVFVTSDPNGMWSTKGYVVHNNMWNASGYNVSETMYACSYKSSYVRATATNRSGDGAVKTYPNVHKDFHDWGSGAEPKVRSFAGISSTFAAAGPDRGIYNLAYDIWLNGVPGNREIMIWTKNHRQTPAGSVVARGLRFSHRTWRVYATDDHEYIAFVPRRPLAQGRVDIKARLDWLTQRGLVPRGSTLGQICYGVEVVSTGGRPARFRFTDFSVSTSRR